MHSSLRLLFRADKAVKNYRLQMILRQYFHHPLEGSYAVQNYRLFVLLGKGELRPEKGNLHLPRSIARKVQTYLANGIRSGNCRLDRREVGIERVPRVNAHSLNGLRLRMRIMRVNVRNHTECEDSEK